MQFLDVRWPASALERVTLIDTPGLASLNDENSRRTREFLDHDGDHAPDADAVIYLMRHLHRSDVEFLDAFMDRSVAAASPVNAVAVLSRADEIGAGRLDAMDSARRHRRALPRRLVGAHVVRDGRTDGGPARRDRADAARRRSGRAARPRGDSDRSRTRLDAALGRAVLRPARERRDRRSAPRAARPARNVRRSDRDRGDQPGRDDCGDARPEARRALRPQPAEPSHRRALLAPRACAPSALGPRGDPRPRLPASERRPRARGVSRPRGRAHRGRRRRLRPDPLRAPSREWRRRA